MGAEFGVIYLWNRDQQGAITILDCFLPAHYKHQAPVIKAYITLGKCFRGSNEFVDATSRLDFRKKEKKAITHTAQNVASNELVRSSCPWSLCKMSGVIGSFCRTTLLCRC